MLIRSTFNEENDKDKTIYKIIELNGFFSVVNYIKQFYLLYAKQSVIT